MSNRLQRWARKNRIIKMPVRRGKVGGHRGARRIQLLLFPLPLVRCRSYKNGAGSLPAPIFFPQKGLTSEFPLFTV